MHRTDQEVGRNLISLTLKLEDGESGLVPPPLPPLSPLMPRRGGSASLKKLKQIKQLVHSKQKVGHMVVNVSRVLKVAVVQAMGEKVRSNQAP